MAFINTHRWWVTTSAGAHLFELSPELCDCFQTKNLGVTEVYNFFWKLLRQVINRTLGKPHPTYWSPSELQRGPTPQNLKAFTWVTTQSMWQCMPGCHTPRPPEHLLYKVWQTEHRHCLKSSLQVIPTQVLTHLPRQCGVSQGTEHRCKPFLLRWLTASASTQTE